MIEIAVTVFGLGRLPKAPGTWGSLPGIALGAYVGFLDLELPAKCILIAAVVLPSYLLIHMYEQGSGHHDGGEIVLDEVVGAMVAVCWWAPSPWLLVAGFALFRGFDIAKPGPIGWIDRSWPGAYGTLMDDVLAGGASALVLFAAKSLL